MFKTLFYGGLSVIGTVMADSKDRVTALPGFDITEPLYSGYLEVTTTKKLHYVFVESKNNAKTDPVLIWFNGGPGCSSLLGFFQENGPFIVEDDGI